MTIQLKLRDRVMVTLPGFPIFYGFVVSARFKNPNIWVKAETELPVGLNVFDQLDKNKGLILVLRTQAVLSPLAPEEGGSISDATYLPIPASELS